MSANEPIFKSVFGGAWDTMPPVLHQHYANRPFSHDVVTVEGVMKVELSLYAKLLSPFLRLAGALVPYTGDNIPTTVHFRSEPDSDVFCFDRIFRFPGKKPYPFRSRMTPIAGNEVVEVMALGLGWRAAYRYDGKKVVLEHRGYVVRLLGHYIRVPIEWFLGSGYAEEEAIDSRRFRMYMDIRHRLFGRVYAYSGEFSIAEVRLDA